MEEVGLNSKPPLGIVAGLILFEVFLNAYRERRLKKISQRFPEELESDWRSKTLQTYRLILRQFLLLAIKIREEYYPHLPTIEGRRVFDEYDIPHIQFSEKPQGNLNSEIDELYAKLDKIVEKHFAFR